MWFFIWTMASGLRIWRDDNPFLHEKIENEKNKDRKGQYYAVFVFCFYHTFVHSSRVINKLSYGICHGFLALGLYK